jgi:hypothetical protein
VGRESALERALAVQEHADEFEVDVHGTHQQQDELHHQPAERCQLRFQTPLLFLCVVPPHIAIAGVSASLQALKQRTGSFEKERERERTFALALLQLAELLLGLAVLHLPQIGALARRHGEHGPNAALPVGDAVLRV